MTKSQFEDVLGVRTDSNWEQLESVVLWVFIGMGYIHEGLWGNCLFKLR